MIRFVTHLLVLLPVIGPILGGAPEWTWVLGRLADEGQQAEYAAFARRMFDYYQARGIFPGRLVDERDLDARPTGPVVFLGPLQAFCHPEWLSPLVEKVDGSVRVGDQLFADPRTGIFARDECSTCVVLTGLSLAGWSDIFAVSTGGRSCTVTVGGRVRFEGDWRAGALVLGSQSWLTPYPDVEELESLGPLESAVVTSAVYADEAAGTLTPGFEADLLALVQDRAVLFVGESHWNVGVNQLFVHALMSLLRGADVRAVFLELPYSYSAHFDRYASLADDGAAHAFLREQLHPLVNAESTLELLELLRRWNLEHPDRRVHVACTDLEFDVQGLVDRVLEPWFRRLEPGFQLRAADLHDARRRAASLEHMRALLAAGSEDAPLHPFLTPAFVAGALANLETTLSMRDHRADRQRAILCNVTERHGALLGEGLAVFKGGSFHAQKARPADLGGESFWRDAAWLQHEHPTTKGRVASLLITGLGYGFGDVAGLDPAKYMRSADNYHDFVERYRRAAIAGDATTNGFYLLEGEPSPVDALVALAGLRTGENVLRLEHVDFEPLARRFRAGARTYAGAGFDAVVYVLRSQLEPTRPRVFSED